MRSGTPVKLTGRDEALHAMSSWPRRRRVVLDLIQESPGFPCTAVFRFDSAIQEPQGAVLPTRSTVHSAIQTIPARGSGEDGRPVCGTQQVVVRKPGEAQHRHIDAGRLPMHS